MYCLFSKAERGLHIELFNSHSVQYTVSLLCNSVLMNCLATRHVWTCLNISHLPFLASYCLTWAGQVHFIVPFSADTEAAVAAAGKSS